MGGGSNTSRCDAPSSKARSKEKRCSATRCEEEEKEAEDEDDEDDDESRDCRLRCTSVAPPGLGTTATHGVEACTRGARARHQHRSSMDARSWVRSAGSYRGRRG